MESLRFFAVMLSTILSGTVVACAGSVVLTQTHPAAPYVCRTGNITLRCQYDGVEGVLNVLWNVDNMTNIDFVTLTLPGHTALDRTDSHQDVVIASFADLRGTYECAVIHSANITSSPVLSPHPIEDEGIALSALTLASRTATTLSVTWSAGYPKCYSFTVSHSTQDGSINVTQPADNDTFHALTSLQPGDTYRIEVEAVRKGDGADGQRAKVVGNFTTEEEAYTSDVVPSRTIPPTTSSIFPPPQPESKEGVIAGVVVGVFVLVLITVALIVASVFFVHRRKPVLGAKASAPNTPTTPNIRYQESVTQACEDKKQTYAVLDWQNPEQRPIKAPDNEWFTVQYSEVQFGGSK